MKKILIPTILVATILVAASFALMPVERAATTHLPTVTATSIADGSVTTTKLSFDTATQPELDAHTATASAHHTKTIDASELTSGTLPTARIGADTIDGAQLTDTIVLDVLTTIDTTTNAGANLEVGTAATAVGIKAILAGSLAGQAIGANNTSVTVTVTGAATGDIAFCTAQDADDVLSIDNIGEISTDSVVVIVDGDGTATGTNGIVDCIVFDIT